MNNKIETIIVKFLRVGVGLVFFVPLIYTSATIFPFIFPKSLAFRFLVELLAIPYLYLMLTAPAYRPRKTKILISIIALLIIETFATIFSIDPLRSFWGNHERMMGLFMYAHVALFALMAVSIYRTKDEWRKLFAYAIVAGAAVTLIGFIQYFSPSFLHETKGGRIYSTFGNAIYLSAYLLMQMYLLAWYIAGEKKIGLKLALLGLLGLEFVAFSWAKTRGALIAIVVSLVFIFLFRAAKNFKARPRVSLAAAALPLVLVAFVFLISGTRLAQNSKFLHQVAELNLRTNTAQTRLMNWKVGLRAWAHRPILGWGPENYYYGFNRYYDPKFYAYGSYETWQDHSHNFLIDKLNDSGILGLAAYLSVFVFAAREFFRESRRPEQKWPSAVMLAALLGYFVQNLFAFDTLGIWITLYAFLGYAHILAAQDTAPKKASEKQPAFLRLEPPARIAMAMGGALGLLILSIFINVIPFSVSAATISAGVNFAQNPRASYDKIYDALQKPSPYRQESRDELSKLVVAILQGASNLSRGDAEKMINDVYGEYKKSSAAHQNDTYYMMNLARWSMLMASVLGPSYYLEAEESLLKAKELSPKRQQIYFTLMRLYLIKGQTENAVELGRQAVELYERVPEARWRYGEALARANFPKDAYKEMRSALRYDYGSPFALWMPQEMELYISLARQNNDEVEALWWEGIGLAAKGDDSAAYKAMKKSLDGGFTPVIYEQMVLFMNLADKTGNPVKDPSWVERYAAQVKSEPYTSVLLSRIFLNRGEREKAREIIAAIYRAYPDRNVRKNPTFMAQISLLFDESERNFK
ncbi:O-antigen ligase family protein [Candidatus Uhrbacteria bacterium]|nr:O-antigen ligase family protein [Candidatus Uhrbacteria bacterium]